MEVALSGLNATYGDYAVDDMEPTTHMIVTATARKSKALATAHCQPPKHAQDYACQPFLHELLNSSPDLVAHEFAPPLDATLEMAPAADAPL
jgi:hypothetical protein